MLIGRDPADLDALVSREFVAHGPGPYECGRQGFRHVLQTASQGAGTRQKPQGVIDAIWDQGDRVIAWFRTDAVIPVDRYLSPEMLDMTRNSADVTDIRVRAAVPATHAVLARLSAGKIEELWELSNYPWVGSVR